MNEQDETRQRLIPHYAWTLTKMSWQAEHNDCHVESEKRRQVSENRATKCVHRNSGCGGGDGEASHKRWSPVREIRQKEWNIWSDVVHDSRQQQQNSHTIHARLWHSLLLLLFSPAVLSLMLSLLLLGHILVECDPLFFYFFPMWHPHRRTAAFSKADVLLGTSSLGTL